MSGLSPMPVQTHLIMFKTVPAWGNQSSNSGFGLRLSKLEHLQSLCEKSLY